MSEKPENTFTLFLLGVLVGVYGNWLISFLDRLVFPTEIGTIFFIQILLVILSFMTFFFYFMSAYLRKYYPTLFWIAHSVSTPIIFIFQDSFVKSDPSSLTQNIVSWTVTFPIFCLILTVEWIRFGRYHKHILKKRWKKPTIGILSDMGWDIKNEEIYTWTDFSPEDWQRAFESSPSTNVELTNVEKSFDRFGAILNPYGGVYPEIDLKNLSTLKKILNFVREGGVFINVADVPSYWAYDQNLRRKLDITSPIYVIKDNQIASIRPFELTPLIKELGLRVLNITLQQDLNQFSKSKVDIVSRRIAVVESNLETSIPTKTTPPNLGNLETSALFTVKYGEGDFIFSLFFINDETHSQKAKDIIKNAISKITLNKLREKASLVS